MAGGHTFHPSILREYDIRGIVGETLTSDDMTALGHAFGTVLRRDGGKTAAVGYDGRVSSPELADALVDGLCRAGIDVVRTGRGPSPMLYFSAFDLGLDAGLMVTGSHNPPEYNGVKIIKFGKAFFGNEIKGLNDISRKKDYEIGAGEVRDEPMLEAYVARLFQDVTVDRPFRVAWDPGNGAAGEALAGLTARMPGEHIILNGEIDGTFPNHHPDPTVEKNLDQLKEAVARENCDLGFAFDGDGDRIGVIDGRGRVIWGDQLLAILARPILARNPGATIIADVKTSQAFFDEITRLGGNPLMWKTGHSHIKTKMAELKAPLAGEMSAHIFFKDGYYGFDDALYAAVRLLNIVDDEGKSLAEIRDELPQTVSTPEIRFDCPDDRKFVLIDELQQRLKGRDGIEVHDMDGVRVQTADGWWLLRASNTQPVLVARCEASDDEGLDRLKAELRREITDCGLTPPEL